MMNKTRPQPHHRLLNSRGFLSADFLFSMVIASGLCAMFFALSITLSMVEIGQYMAFSITRAHMAGHSTQDLQEKMAQNKFKAFRKNKVLNPLLTNGWFEITNLDIRGGGPRGKDFTDRYPREEVPGIPQVGIRLDFNAKILKGKIPMLGATDGSIEHKAFITGLMIREPSSEECYGQIRDPEQRYKAILELDPRFKKIVGNNSESKYVGMEDNGC